MRPVAVVCATTAGSVEVVAAGAATGAAAEAEAAPFPEETTAALQRTFAGEEAEEVEAFAPPAMRI